MEVLIDTNVFIEREGDSAIPESLQELENLLRTNGHTILVHPLSKDEVRAYDHEERREIQASKIATYAELSFATYPRSAHTEFRDEVPEADDRNEEIDNALLFAVYDEQVDFLITEDGGIHHKARLLGIDDKVLDIDEGSEQFRDDQPAYDGPPSIQQIKVGELNVEDPIFDTLKDEYEGFTDWLGRHPDRTAYVSVNPDETLGAVLILKPNEAEALGCDPELPPRDRLKICTLIVSEERRGSKIGELLIGIGIREAIDESLEEVYLTHRISEEDHLVQLISEYGFERATDQENGESVFLKRLTPGPGDDPDPVEMNIRFYPSYYDGPDVDKFLVPIRPQFHGRLFPDYDKRHPKLKEFNGQFYSEGNAIKKAYLSHAPTRQIEQGDLLLFYRSYDHKEITSVGVCDRVEYEIDSVQAAQELIGQRSVFSRGEMEEQCSDPVTVILFKWHFDLENPLHYQVLRDEEVLSGPAQTIQQIDHDDYTYIRDAGGIDERFTFH